jgi:hypothetical protein
MKDKRSNEKFTIEEYQAIVAEIYELALNYATAQIKKQMPESLATPNTLYYVILRVVTRAICMMYSDNAIVKQQAVSDFCNTLPKLFR